MYYFTNYQSLLGKLTMVANTNKLIGLWVEGQKHFLSSVKTLVVEKNNLAIFENVKTWLDLYFNGHNPNLKSLELAPIGTPFQQDVWDLICKIPYGEVRTYKELAIQIAQKHHRVTMSAQAIGGAVSHNPIAIIIPCHRVVGLNNNLTGYAGGIEKKIKLLNIEGNDISKFRIIL